MKIASLSHLRDVLLLDSQRYRTGGGKAVVKLDLMSMSLTA